LSSVVDASRRSASRTDPVTGVRETIEYFRAQSGFLYGSTFRPATAPSAGIVICSPILAELHTSYRREVLLARTLAQGGFAVQRFHYLGSGNSDGTPEAETLEGLVDDARRATERLRETTQVRRLAFVGTRLGGHVAAAIARTYPGSPVAIVSPVLDAESYFQEVLRGHLFGRVKEGTSSSRSTADVLAELRAQGSLDVLGYPLGWSLYETFVGRPLSEELAAVECQALLIKVGRARGSSPLGLETAEGPVKVMTIPGTDVWWFGGGAFLRDGEAATTEAIIDAVHGWADLAFAERAP